MLERILENWLDKASEKSFQLPFCYMLAKQGHTIIHLARHSLMEYGKDVITISPQGKLCAYQLKGAPGEQIKYSQYRVEIMPQLRSLTGIPISHPSVKSARHESYFVTNGNLQEEVANAINLVNQQNIVDNRPDLVVHTIVRGQLLEMAKSIQLEMLPSDLRNFNQFLELYLENGQGMLNKDKFARLLKNLYEPPKVGAKEKREIISSVAMIVSLVVHNYADEKNHLALVEAWTMFLAYTFRFIESNRLSPQTYQVEIELVREAILNELDDLLEELKADHGMIHPKGPEENLQYHAKMNWLSGFLAFRGMYAEKTADQKIANEVDDFLKNIERNVDPYGESVFAPMLNVYWFRRMRDATLRPQVLLQQLFQTAISPMERSSQKSGWYLPSPYYDIEACLTDRYRKDKLIPKASYESYYAEPLLTLVLRENMKQFLRREWSTYSKFHLKEFRYRRITDFYLWRAEEGDEVTKLNRTGNWNELREEALKIDESLVPEMFRMSPELIPLFLLVYPHRINSNVIKFVEVFVRDRSKIVKSGLKTRRKKH